MATNPLACDLCKKTFSGEHDSISHFTGRKHLEASRKHLSLVEQENDVKCGVYITGFGFNQTKEDALQYFSRYGGIRKSLVGPTLSYMIIVYETAKEAASVLSCQHFFGGRKLRVEKRQPPSNNRNEDKMDHESHEKLVQSLQDLTNFEKQIDKFVYSMTPDLQNISWTYNLVNQDVFDALSLFFHPCYIWNFGSSTTFLQFTSSDLDIYVDIMKRPVSDKKCLKMVRSALSRSRLFHNIIDIPSAKIPIVKAIHSQTGMKCDINFKNMVGVENSRLIRYYLSLDPRLRKTMLVIKYWAKIQGISGRNHLFTSYSMVMMFIFYLQKYHSFPSVHELQKNTVPTDSRVVWNMNIIPTEDMRQTIKVKTIPIKDILMGFFKYYSTFKFDLEIICPYLGKTVEKQCFSDISLIPEQLELYKVNTDIVEPLKYDKPVCLQDPFELNVNTCSIIFKNTLDRYIVACSSAVEILSSNNQNMLIQLFSVAKGDVNPPKKKKKKEDNDPDRYNILLEKADVVNYLRSDSNADISKVWFQHTIDYCCTIFEKVLRLDVEPKENNKAARVGKQQDVHDCDNIKIFHAVSFVDLWNSRNINPVKIKDKLNICKTTLEKDIVISDYIWGENAQIRPTVPIFECDIILTYLKEPVRMNIEIVRINSHKKMFKSFALYISTKIPQWFSLHTKELKRQHDIKSSKEIIIID